MSILNKNHLFRVIESALLVILLLGLLTRAALASPHYQTVPTMPPPTPSPSATSTLRAQPTATHPQPTATRPQATSLPPTQTAIAATETVVALTSSPTSTSIPATGTPSPTQTIAPALPPLLIATSIPPATFTHTPTTTPQPVEAGGGNLGLVCLVGGLSIVVIIILLGIWLVNRRRSSTPQSR